MLDLQLNLLPGAAEEERKLRELRKKRLLVALYIIVNIAAAALTTFLVVHNIALQNNLSEVNTKLATTKQEITKYTILEKDVKNLKKRITAIEEIEGNKVFWDKILQAIANNTMGSIQYKDIEFQRKSKIEIDGYTGSMVALEKNKATLAKATLDQEYTILERDTWERIAKKFSFSLSEFYEIHELNPEELPELVPGEIFIIKKPLFKEVLLIDMQAPKQFGNNSLSFTMELNYHEGVFDDGNS